MPQIMAGLTQTIMLSLSMVVIAALVGRRWPGRAGGARAQHGQHRQGLRGGSAIVLIAIVLDRLFRAERKGAN
jgi:glycine betaine/proline transport system permease protein